MQNIAEALLNLNAKAHNYVIYNFITFLWL